MSDVSEGAQQVWGKLCMKWSMVTGSPTFRKQNPIQQTSKLPKTDKSGYIQCTLVRTRSNWFYRGSLSRVCYFSMFRWWILLFGLWHQAVQSGSRFLEGRGQEGVKEGRRHGQVHTVFPDQVLPGEYCYVKVSRPSKKNKQLKNK